MEQTKTLLASRTVWGAAIAVLAAVAGLFGYVVAPDDQARAADLAGEILGLWDRLAVVAGGALAIWGRVKASKRIA
ncbi:hypothetical protein [Prosthecomicrobium sp. N25]|uniref:hypothetical protein n=1 Tax=Prosthecomicrobium sp. N25 TaxID=3129254 RepID=UPI0030787E33